MRYLNLVAPIVLTLVGVFMIGTTPEPKLFTAWEWVKYCIVIWTMFIFGCRFMEDETP